MLPRKRHSLVGFSLLALVLAWGCGDGGGCDGGPAPGSLVWAKRAGGADSDKGQRVAVLSDDSVVVVGRFGGTATFGPGESNETSLTSAGGDDIFVARYNSDGTLAWVKRAGGSLGYDWGEGVAALSGDSMVVTGRFYDTATFGPGEPNETTLTSAGTLDDDAFVARYNADGTLAWAKSAGGAGYEWGFGVAVLSDDSVAVTGYFGDTATFGPGETNEASLTSAGDRDVFIARYNADGTLAWAKSAGGVDFDFGRSVAALSDDSVVVAGSFRDTATFGPGESNETGLTSAGYDDIFVARYNADGSLSWAGRAGGGGNFEEGFDVAVLSDDSAVVTGIFMGAATFGPGEANETNLTSAGEVDMFIARYNPDGTLAWAERVGDSSGDGGRGIVVLSDNSALVTGCFSGTVTFGPGDSNETVLTSAGSTDVFIACYKADGTLAWARRAGGADSDTGVSVGLLSDDSAVVTGYFSMIATFGQGEANETSLTSAGDRDIFIARYNP